MKIAAAASFNFAHSALEVMDVGRVCKVGIVEVLLGLDVRGERFDKL